VTLRPASEEDCALVMAWRNDPASVRFSVTGRAVSAEEHQRWFAGILEAGSRTRLWIGEEDGVPVGQVRIDAGDAGGTVSIAVAAEHRGRGIGTAMLRSLVGEVVRAALPRPLTAVVRPDNVASLRAFEAAGFHTAGSATSEFVHLQWP
jgi:UDP-2,4-diacetamido-2,4,6-trideoxy-beta-L-altropyranose hydrolase